MEERKLRITFIKPFKIKRNNLMMKHLREEDKEKNKIFDNVKKFNSKILIKIKENKNKKNIKTIFKKNQIALFATSLMLITAGYLNYSNNIKKAALGDAKLVSTDVIENEETNDTEKNSSLEQVNINSKNSMNEKKNESVTKTSSRIDEEEIVTENYSKNEKEETATETATETSTKSIEDNKNDDYFIQSKLDRNTMYSQMLETYENILANEKIPNDQKSIAANEIKNINDRKNATLTIENLLKTKGLEQTLILTNDNNVDVVVKSKENLEQDKVAQILNIVSRELNVPAENIHISIYN